VGAARLAFEKRGHVLQRPSAVLTPRVSVFAEWQESVTGAARSKPYCAVNTRIGLPSRKA
jgi:hypothetical protein